MRTEHDRAGGGHVVFVVDGIVVLIWTRPPAVAGIVECRRQFEVVARTKARFGYLGLVEIDAGKHMAAPVRAELRALFKEYESRVAASAVVFEGKGFGAAIVRSVVSAIDLALRPQFPSKVHADLETAASWLLANMTGLTEISASALIAKVNRGRGLWRETAKAS